MSDPTDIATDREEIARQAALTVRRPAGPAATGCCHYCEEPVAEGLRFCNAGCRDDYETEQRRRRANRQVEA